MTDFSPRSLIPHPAPGPLVAKGACVGRLPADPPITVAPAVDGDVVVPLAQAPELSAAGGAVIARPAGSAGGFLVAFTGTGYVALRAECPHEGCDVAWVPEDREVECPCHGSRFAGDGT